MSPFFRAHYKQSNILTMRLEAVERFYSVFFKIKLKEKLKKKKKKQPERVSVQEKLKKPVGAKSRCFTPKRVNSICRA